MKDYSLREKRENYAVISLFSLGKSGRKTLSLLTGEREGVFSLPLLSFARRVRRAREGRMLICQQ